MKILHVYAIDCPHMDAYIAGNLDGLLVLRDLIDSAIASANGKVEGVVFVNDGEGFDLHVLHVKDDKTMNALTTPYTSPDAGGPREGAIHPAIYALSPETRALLVQATAKRIKQEACGGLTIQQWADKLAEDVGHLTD